MSITVLTGDYYELKLIITISYISFIKIHSRELFFHLQVNDLNFFEELIKAKNKKDCILRKYEKPIQKTLEKYKWDLSDISNISYDDTQVVNDYNMLRSLYKMQKRVQELEKK